ncbi:AMP-binding protein, partial [Streptomyces sp. S3(2020)]|uniref:AMP-binding protein n=1 Tax=Streptomyces sp. S3(2020) TaxID=2732044 RepID=UPI0014884189
MTGGAGAVATAGSASAAQRIDELLLERLGRDPGRAALVCADGTVISAGRLRERVLAVAASLRARGLGPGDRVAVYHERSVEFVAAVLGVACAGAAHAAFDVADPPARTLGMLEDCAPRAVLTSRALRDRLAGCGVPMLTDDEGHEGRTAPADGPPSPSPSPLPSSPDDPVALTRPPAPPGPPLPPPPPAPPPPPPPRLPLHAFTPHGPPAHLPPLSPPPVAHPPHARPPPCAAPNAHGHYPSR